MYDLYFIWLLPGTGTNCMLYIHTENLSINISLKQVLGGAGAVYREGVKTFIAPFGPDDLHLLTFLPK